MAESHPAGGRIPEEQQYRQEIDALIKLFNEEDGLCGMVEQNRKATVGVGTGNGGSSVNTNAYRKKIVALIEGSKLPFSALVKDIVEQLSSAENDLSKTIPPIAPAGGCAAGGAPAAAAVTLASVRSHVLSLGERVSFGITNPDTDVLEDDSVRSLWRWEVRDARLLSKALREKIVDRRRWRKKIAERIRALSATVQALVQVVPKEVGGNIQYDAYFKAKEALTETDNEFAIRAVIVDWRGQQEKLGTGAAGDSNVVFHESPFVRGDQQLQLVTSNPAEASTPCTTLKRRRRDSEEIEKERQEKLLKRKKSEVEREQRRKGREEADQRKQLALKKQASFMNRLFGKKNQTGSTQSQKQQQSEAPAAGVAASAASSAPQSAGDRHGKDDYAGSQSSQQSGDASSIATRMDRELQQSYVSSELEGLRRSHVHHWQSLRHRFPREVGHSWSVRRKPKVSVYRELRLQGADSRGGGESSRDESPARRVQASRNTLDDSPAAKKAAAAAAATRDANLSGQTERAGEEFDECELDSKEDTTMAGANSSPDGAKKHPLSSQNCNSLRKRWRKLLQFAENHRPPYYGTFSKRSKHIKPRRPLSRDPALNYDIDSDEEWEEDDPGESLSDLENDDDDDEKVIEVEDDEDSADDFFVPDGYLSENEGVLMVEQQQGELVLLVPAGGGLPEGGAKSRQQPLSAVMTHLSPATPTAMAAQHSGVSPERLRKVVDHAIESAMRSNHPLVISNLGHVPCYKESDIPVPSSASSSSQLPSSKRAEVLCLEALRMRVLVCR